MQNEDFYDDIDFDLMTSVHFFLIQFFKMQAIIFSSSKDKFLERFIRIKSR